MVTDEAEVDRLMAESLGPSLRTYLVASVMEAIPRRMNLTTTGYNRNVFKFNGARLTLIETKGNAE